jgi:hypothetical protein
MPQLSSRRKCGPMAAAILLLLLAGVLLAACGGSSNSSTTATSASTRTGTGTGTTTSTTGKAPRFADRFAAVRECLKKEGITLPTRKPGQRPGGGGFLGGGGGAALPAGVSKAKFESALKKCGGNFAGGRGGSAGGTSRFETTEAKKALAKFAACLRENGVKVGEPNTSGKGPIFNSTGIDTKSAQFTAAETKCSGDLRGAFGARPGAGGSGAPPAGAAG